MFNQSLQDIFTPIVLVICLFPQKSDTFFWVNMVARCRMRKSSSFSAHNPSPITVVTRWMLLFGRESGPDRSPIQRCRARAVLLIFSQVFLFFLQFNRNQINEPLPIPLITFPVITANDTADYVPSDYSQRYHWLRSQWLQPMIPLITLPMITSRSRWLRCPWIRLDTADYVAHDYNQRYRWLRYQWLQPTIPLITLPMITSRYLWLRCPCCNTIRYCWTL